MAYIDATLVQQNLDLPHRERTSDVKQHREAYHIE